MKDSLIFLRTVWRLTGCPVGRRCAPEWDRVGWFFFFPTSAKFHGSVVSSGWQDRKGANLGEECILLAWLCKWEVPPEWAPAGQEEPDGGEVQAGKETTAYGMTHLPPTEDSPLLQRDSRLTRRCFEYISYFWEHCRSCPSNDSFLLEAHTPSRQTKLKIYFSYSCKKKNHSDSHFLQQFFLI